MNVQNHLLRDFCYGKSTVSVIVPAYNVERFISDALNSILEQAPPPHEVLVIDDGSTDSTYKEICKFSGNKKVKVFRTANKGPGPARNYGKKHATGEYICFFDSDDLLANNFFELIDYHINANNNPDAILFSGESFTDGDNSIGHSADYKKHINATFDTGGAAIRALLKAKSFKPNAWLYVTKKEIWTKNDLCFLPIIHEDEEIIFRLLSACNHVVVIEDVLVYHRIWGESIMSKKPDQRNLDGYHATLKSLVDCCIINPKKVDSEKDLWEDRIRDFAHAYIRLAKQLDARIDFDLVLRAHKVNISPAFYVRTIFYLLPTALQRLIKNKLLRAIGRSFPRIKG
jgi:glycosyltransferase involved in cell wall biosynthesis